MRIHSDPFIFLLLPDHIGSGTNWFAAAIATDCNLCLVRGFSSRLLFVEDPPSTKERSSPAKNSLACLYGRALLAWRSENHQAGTDSRSSETSVRGLAAQVRRRRFRGDDPARWAREEKRRRVGPETHHSSCAPVALRTEALPKGRGQGTPPRSQPRRAARPRETAG